VGDFELEIAESCAFPRYFGKTPWLCAQADDEASGRLKASRIVIVHAALF
jgi:hypothetical protein